MRESSAAPLFVLLLGCGCSSDGASGTPNPGGSGGDACELRVALGGAVADQLSWDLSEGCGGGADAAAESVALGWGGITIPLNFHLTVQEIAEGEVGPAFPATARVKDGDRIWRTVQGACMAEVAHFELRETNSVGKSYRVAGSGSCSGAAEAAEGGAVGSVTIGPFVFRGAVLYPD
jgi:hypothetical protein